jgi:hypothetical protein
MRLGGSLALPIPAGFEFLHTYPPRRGFSGELKLK